MLKNIYILRHSDAVNLNEKGVYTDRDRFLSDEGKEKMVEVAKGIKKLGIDFDKIYTSPYPRARQTAEILAETYKINDKIEDCDLLTPEKSPNDMIDYLVENHTEDSVCLVGHEPLLSEIVSVLISEYPNASIKLKKASLCKIKVHAVSKNSLSAELEFIATPKILKALN
jgi:phosphohistidine phosphatase